MDYQTNFSLGDFMTELSSILVEQPHALFALLFLIPAILFVFFKFQKLSQHSQMLGTEQKSSLFFRRLKIALFLRTFFRCLAWIFLVLAFSGISWGTKKIPVQKSGSNVSFVFDISYSMLAKDVADGSKRISRLDAVKLYVSSLLERLDAVSFSAILAKGDGFVAIPETEDRAAIETLLENLSPTLITTAGSSLGKGIEAALNAIPAHSAKTNCIFVFTDGDETDNGLEKSLELAAKYAIPVALVGFGSETESEITAGDGKTKVRTALRAQKMAQIVENVNKRNFHGVHAQHLSRYIDSKSTGSAWKLLNQIDEHTISYEMQVVDRHRLFIFLSIFFVMLSFVTGECSPEQNFPKFFKKLLAKSLVVLCIFSFSSCKSEKKEILDGVWAWYEGKYAGATADFLNAANRPNATELSHEYALFNLSATYLTLGETNAALDRLSEMNLESEFLPGELKSAAFYNKGIIFAQNGDYDGAAEQFKRAILENPENLNAKINLELCEREVTQKKAREGEAQMQGVNEEKAENSDMESEIFNLIHEAESKKWRNMNDGKENENNVVDY